MVVSLPLPSNTFSVISFLISGTLNFFFGVIVKAPSGRLAGIPVWLSIRFVSASLAPASEIPKDPSGRFSGIPVILDAAFIRLLSASAFPFADMPNAPSGTVFSFTLSIILLVFTF